MKGSIALAALCFCVTPCGAEPLVIAERGKAAECSIMIPAKASPAHRYAAEELRDWTEKATGVRLPIVAGTGPIPAKAIVIDAGTGEADGFRLKVDGGVLRIVGENDRGALYGVYEVLERFAGCRWYSSWRTVVPCRDRIEIPADLDETQTPALV